MLKNRRLIRSICAALVMFGAACGGFASLKDLQSLQTALTQKFGEQTTVNISNNSYLLITFVNSKSVSADSAERAEFAHGVAQFAFEQYARRDSLESIGVRFSTVRGGAGVSITHSDAPYSWKATELRAVPDSARHVPADSGKRGG